MDIFQGFLHLYLILYCTYNYYGVTDVSEFHFQLTLLKGRIPTSLQTCVLRIELRSISCWYIGYRV